MSLVSIIVPTLNSEKTIDSCLRSIKNQTYKQLEIIVVDNNSIDKTRAIAKKYTKQVYIAGIERSSQRNFGVKQAHGEYLFFLDSDMTLSKKVISECIALCRANSKLVGLYIPENIIGKSFWAKTRNFERKFYNQTVLDAMRFVKKSAFDKISGFDENLVAGEDWDLNRRLWRLGKTDIIKSPLYHHEENFVLKYFLGKKIHYAYCLDNYCRKWGRNDPIIQKQLGFKYRFFSVFFQSGKMTEIIRHPFLFGGVILLKILVGWQWLIHQLITKTYHHPLFSYCFPTQVHELKKELKNCRSVLDLGCGHFSPVKYCPWIKYSVGVEAFAPYIDQSKKEKIHSKYLLSKVEEVDFLPKSFDAVIMIEVLEHLPKKIGLQMIKKIEKWARKKVIITTPNGFLPQKQMDNNPRQIHLSGWDYKTMKGFGYEIKGLSGFKFLRKGLEGDMATIDLMASIRFSPRLFWFIMTTLTQIIAYRVPATAFELFCVKKVK